MLCELVEKDCKMTGERLANEIRSSVFVHWCLSKLVLDKVSLPQRLKDRGTILLMITDEGIAPRSLRKKSLHCRRYTPHRGRERTYNCNFLK